MSCESECDRKNAKCIPQWSPLNNVPMVTYTLGTGTTEYAYGQFLIQSQQYPLIFPQCTPYGDIPPFPITGDVTITTPFPDVNRDAFIENITAMFTPFGFTDMNTNRLNLLLSEILMDIGALYPTPDNSAEIYATISNLASLTSILSSVITSFKDVVTIQEVITWAGIGNCFTWYQRSKIVTLSLYPAGTGTPAVTDWFLILKSLSWYWTSYSNPTDIFGIKILPPDGWATLVSLANFTGCKSEFAKLSNSPLFTSGGTDGDYIAIVNATLVYNICVQYPNLLYANNVVTASISSVTNSITSGNTYALKIFLYIIVLFYATNMLVIPSQPQACCECQICCEEAPTKCDDTTTSTKFDDTTTSTKFDDTTTSKKCDDTTTSKKCDNTTAPKKHKKSCK